MKNFFICETPEGKEKSLSKSVFPRYILPVEYMWPFGKELPSLEKTLVGIVQKLSHKPIRSISVTSHDVGAKSFATGLKGRLVQEFQLDEKSFNHIHIFVGKGCLYGGIVDHRDSLHTLPGGMRYAAKSHKGKKLPSRASGKIIDSLDALALFGQRPKKEALWLELGASPGGITAELLGRGFHVMAVDRAPLESFVERHPNCVALQEDANYLNLKYSFDVLSSDMNGDNRLAGDICIKNTKYLKRGGIGVFTLKIEFLEDFFTDYQLFLEKLKDKGLKHIGSRHLFHNRQEITVFFKK